MFRGKKYQDSVKLVEKSKFYDTNGYGPYYKDS